MLQFLRRCLRKIPLLSGLADCRAQDHKEALLELIYTLGGTLFPFVLGGIILLVQDGTDSKFFISALWYEMLSTAKNGELLLSATSLLSPIIYLAITNHNEGVEFPTKHSHVIFVLILLTISSALFGVMRSGLKIEIELLFNISWPIFLFSIFLLYLAITYRNRISPKGLEDIKYEERDFSRRYIEERG